MSKVKSSDLPHYELLCLFSNKFSETEVEPIVKSVDKIIADQGGKITLQDYWGKRKLAYRVDGFRHGYYYLVEFDLEGPKLNEINNRLRLFKDIVRHQIVKKRVKTETEIAEEKKIAEKIAARKSREDKENKEGKEELIKKEVRKEETKPESIKSENDTRADLKSLDEELDKIIDSANLL